MNELPIDYIDCKPLYWTAERIAKAKLVMYSYSATPNNIEQWADKRLAEENAGITHSWSE
jgi:hypothetical protein